MKKLQALTNDTIWFFGFLFVVVGIISQGFEAIVVISLTAFGVWFLGDDVKRFWHWVKGIYNAR